MIDDDNADPEIRIVEEPAPATKQPDAPAAFRKDDRDRPRQQEEDTRRDRARRIEDSDGDDDLGRRARQRINQMRRRVGDAESRAVSLETENRRLAAQLQEASTAALTHYEGAALARVDAAQREAREAYESGDGQRVVEANRKLASAQYAVDNVEAVKARKPADAQQQQQQPARPTYSEQTQEWIDDHPWFDSDAKSKKVAVNIHEVMVDEGFTPDTPAYFRELTKRCKTALPRHFTRAAEEPDDEDEIEDDEPPARRRQEAVVDDDPPRRRQAPVSGVNRATPTAPRRVTEVKLSKDQLEAAAIAGVTPKAYALQMLRAQKKA